MSDADDLVRRLRERLTAIETRSSDKLLMAEAADMIEQMAQRIEADDKFFKVMERRHAD